MNDSAFNNSEEYVEYPIVFNNHTPFIGGPRRDTLYVVIPVTIIYSFIFVTGVLGNVVTCIVIAKNKYMHTATNYYLFSLAISDLLLLVTGMPQEMVSIWYKYPYLFSEPFCVLRGFAAETSANATVLTITAFTVERYIAICHPFLSQTMSKLSRAIKLIVAIWLVAMSCALPYAVQVGVVHEVGNPDAAICTFTSTLFEHSFEVSTLVFFVIPMTIITVLYALIGLKLRKASILRRESGSFYKASNEQRSLQSRKHHVSNQSSGRIVNMLAAVVAAFFICWAPFHAQRLVAIYGINEDNRARTPVMVHVYHVVTYISGILYYLSATINPILYHIMSLKFREAFKESMARCCGLATINNTRRERCYSVLSRSHQQGHSHSTENSNSCKEDSGMETTYISRFNKHHKKRSITETTLDSVKSELSSERVGSQSESTNRNRSARDDVFLGSREPLAGTSRSTNPPQFSMVLKLHPTRPRHNRRFPRLAVWSVFHRCTHRSKSIKKIRAKYYIETAGPYEMSLHGQPAILRCSLGRKNGDISNSSLKDFDSTALQDELKWYITRSFEEERI